MIGFSLEVSVRETPKVMKKGEKSLKKVLTFRMKFDKIHKLTRAGHRREALNLENDTDRITQIMTVIPNELSFAGETRLRYKQD